MPIAVLALSLATVGCGQEAHSDRRPAKPESVELTLDGYASADHAGIYMAKKLGYFEDAGIDLSIHFPINPRRPIPYVAEGIVQLSISREPELILARERGHDIVAVGALVHQPLTSLIWLKRSHIHGVAGLRGRTVATPGLFFQEALLRPILGRAGLTPEDLKVTQAGYLLVPALSSGRAAATLGGFWNSDGIELRQRHESPIVVPVDRLGVPPYEELVIVAKRSFAKRHGDVIRRFLGALARGTAAAKANPEAAAEALLEEDPELNRRLVRAELKVTLPLLSGDQAMDPAQWRRFIAWMRKRRLISGSPTPAEALTNAYASHGRG